MAKEKLKMRDELALRLYDKNKKLIYSSKGKNKRERIRIFLLHLLRILMEESE